MSDDEQPSGASEAPLEDQVVPESVDADGEDPEEAENPDSSLHAGARGATRRSGRMLADRAAKAKAATKAAAQGVGSAGRSAIERTEAATKAAAKGVGSAGRSAVEGTEAATKAAARGVGSAGRSALEGTEAATKAAAKGAGSVSRSAVARTEAATQAATEGVGAAARATKRHMIAASGVAQGLVVGIGPQINQIVQSAVSGSASVYDKALDANYLDPLLRSDMGGSYHRLFDGGHTIAGAVKAVSEAPIDDGITQQALGTVEALLRDVSTERGLPLATWDKATFDSVAQSLDSTLGIPKRWLYDINTFDAADVLGATLGVVTVALNWNSADTEQFAQVVASMGLSAAVGLNPLLLLVTLVAAAQAFNKARQSGDYSGLADGAFKGAATSAASLGAVAILTAAGGPAGAGLLVGVAAGVLVQQATKNVSVSDIAGYVTDRATVLSSTVSVWAQDVLNRDDADPADWAVAQQILELPSVATATKAAAPIVDTLNEALTTQSA